MGGSCHLEIGKILDDLVLEADVPKASDGQQCMMLGGLDAEFVDFPKNVLDDLFCDLVEASACNRVSCDQYPNVFSNYPYNATNFYEYSGKKDRNSDHNEHAYDVR